MKKFLIIFFLLVFSNNFVFAFHPKCGGNLSKIDKEKYYVICTQNGFIVREEIESKKYLYGYYNKDAEKELDVIYDYVQELNFNNTRIQRFLIIKENNKYALYDIKTKKLSEFIYDKINGTRLAGTPVTIQDGKKFYVQPYKEIAFSTVKGLGIAVATIIMLPFAIIVIPLGMLIMGE